MRREKEEEARCERSGYQSDALMLRERFVTKMCLKKQGNKGNMKSKKKLWGYLGRMSVKVVGGWGERCWGWLQVGIMSGSNGLTA